MRKLKLLMVACAVTVGTGWSTQVLAYDAPTEPVMPQPNFTASDGVTPEAGQRYYILNLGSNTYLGAGLDYGTRTVCTSEDFIKPTANVALSTNDNQVFAIELEDASDGLFYMKHVGSNKGSYYVTHESANSWIDGGTDRRGKWKITKTSDGYLITPDDAAENISFGVHGSNLVSSTVAYTWTDLNYSTLDLPWVYWAFIPVDAFNDYFDQLESYNNEKATYSNKVSLYNALTNAEAYVEHSTDNHDGTAKSNLSAAISEAGAVYENSSATNEEISAQLTALNIALSEFYKSGATPGEGYPFDLTSVISNWDFTGCSNGNFPGWTISAPNGGNTWVHGSTAVEYWIGSAANGAFDYYQELSGLPEGKYTISASMWNSTNGESGATTNGNAGVYGSNGSSTVFAGVTDDSDDNSLHQYTTDAINILDGKLRIGVKNNGTMGARWFGVDWIKLTMIDAPDLSDYITAYETAKANAEAVDQDKKMAASILSGLQEAISSYASVDQTDINALKEAIAALSGATDKAAISIASYAIIESGSVPTDKQDGWTCTNSQTFHINTWSVEGNPGNDPSGMTTPFIENWIGKGSFLGEGTFSYTLEGLEPGESYYASGLIRSYNEASAEAPNGPDFFVNESVSNLSEAGVTFTYNNMSGIYATLGAIATVGEDGKLTIGARIASDANYNWVAFKNVAIQNFDDALAAAVAKAKAMYESLPEVVKNTLESVVDDNRNGTDETAINNINAAITEASAAASVYPAYAKALEDAKKFTEGQANVGSEAFQIPSSAVSDLESAVTTAENADLSTAENIKQATTELSEATGTFKNAELNQPTDDQLFNIILTYGGWTYDNKAMTYLANDRTDMGNYNIQYKEAANTNLAQAFTFTKVEGNNYKLSQIDADGYVRYLSSGVPHGGNSVQIRTTTSESEALIVTVIPTATEGVWNLRNTEANQYIGSQDAGVYTVNSHIDFKLVETAKASVEVNTSEAGWGTIIAPFAVNSIPSDVKVYSCTAVDGNELMLTEVTALEANKPYIIEGSWNEILSDDAQGTALTYTDGLLTGVYAEQAATDGTYVLQNNTDGVGFYKVASGSEPTIEANHAYLTVSSSARAFLLDGEATAIKAIEALTSGEAEIYNAAGARQQGLQKGVNIVKTAGKTVKVMVK